MVTNKTRLLSALMAILMLVSLFTGFVLPVTAETEVKWDDLTSITDLVAGTTNENGYSVGSKAELELLAQNKATLGLTADDTIYFKDIDLTEGLEEGTYYTGSANAMDGLIAGLDGRFGSNGAATIKGLNLTSPWLGHYAGGKNIQNLVFDNCRYIEDNTEGRDKNYRPGLIFAGYYSDVTTVTVDTFTLKNITMRDCTVDASASPARAGFMFGRIAKATDCVIDGIAIENCSFNPGTNGNVGFLCAEMRTITNAVTIKNIYMNGNSVESVGMTNHNILIGESTISNLTLSNAIVMNTQVPDNIKGFGLFTQKAKNSTYKLNNIIFVNNGAFSSGTQNTSATYGGSSVCYGYEGNTSYAAKTFSTSGKIYADTEKISWTGDKTAQTEDVRTAAYNAVASGQAAWELNVARASTDAYYTMVADADLGVAPAFGTADNKTIKVVVNIEGTDEVRIFYPNLDGEIDVAHPGLLPETAVYTCEYGTITDGKLTLNESAKDAADLTIEVNGSGKPNKAALEQKINEIGEDAKFYLKGDVMLSETTDMSDAQAVVENDNATVTDVENAIKKLEAYARVTVDDEDAKEVQFILNLNVFNEDTTTLLATVNNAFSMPETDGKAIVAKNTALANAVAAFDAATLTVKSGARVPHKYYENKVFADVKDWWITDAEDWKTVINRGKVTFEDETITLKNDIDFEGATIAPVAQGASTSLEVSLTLDGAGHRFKNVTISGSALIDAYFYGTITDLILDDTCKVESTGRYAASFVKRLYGTLKDCWSAAYIKHEYSSDKAVNADVRTGGLVGEMYDEDSLIDGCYFAGTIDCSSWQVGAVSDWQVGTVINSFVKPTYIIPEGFIGSSGSTPGGCRVRLAHILAVTGEGYLFEDLYKNTYGVGVDPIYQGSSLYVKPDFMYGDVSYDGRPICNHNAMHNVSANEYADGAMAWKLTNESTHKGTGDVTYYTVENGKTVHGTADTQMRRITLKQGEIEYYAYVVNDTAFNYGGNAYVADQDLVINVEGVLPTEHTIVRTDVGTGSHIETCTAEGIVIAEGIIATCGLKELKACAYDIPFDIPATCTEDGKKGTLCACGHVGTEEKTDDKTGHDMQETTPEDPAKCEVPGTTAILTCANGCGKTEGGETIPALEHDMQLTNEEEPAQCEEPGKTALYTCANNCGKTEGGIEIPKLGHDYDYENGIKTDATVEKTGKIEYACRNGCNIPKIVILDKLAGLEITAEALEANNPLVKVDVKLLNYGAKEVTLKVNYDYINMTLTETDVISTHFTVVAFSAENGVAEIKLMADADVGKDEVVATLNFKLTERAYNGEYVFNATAEGVNLAGEPVAYEPAEEKTANVTWRVDKVDGDLNIDGNVDLLDAILLMRYINNELPEEYQTIVTDEMADLTDVGDGTEEDDIPDVNVDDVIHLLRYLNGWIDTLK